MKTLMNLVIGADKDKRKMEQQFKLLIESGVGVSPSKGGGDKHMNDCHVWLEDDKGNIIDPTPPAYDFPIVYKPFDKKQQVRVWGQYQAKIKGKGKQGRTLMKKTHYEKPRHRQCGYNVFAYWSHNKHLKIVVGSAGFKFNKHTIFWEFG